MKKIIPMILIQFTLIFFLLLNSEESKTKSIDDVCELEGYTMIDCSRVDGEFEGEDGDIVKLYNGWIFELDSYDYNYAYNPEIGIFARQLKYQDKSFTVYKLLIEDAIYSASRLR